MAFGYYKYLKKMNAVKAFEYQNLNRYVYRILKYTKYVHIFIGFLWDDYSIAQNDKRIFCMTFGLYQIWVGLHWFITMGYVKKTTTTTTTQDAIRKSKSIIFNLRSVIAKDGLKCENKEKERERCKESEMQRVRESERAKERKRKRDGEKESIRTQRAHNMKQSAIT